MKPAILIMAVAITIFIGAILPAIAEEPAQPNESQVMRATIQGYLSQNDTVKAMEKLKNVLGSTKYQDIKAWAADELWNKAQASGQIAAVISDLEGLEAGNPDDRGLKLAIAEGYIRLRDFNKVVSIYEGLLQKDPENYVLKTRLNDYYILGQQYDKAIANLAPIVEANPDDKYHSDILLNAYTQAGMKDKALTLYKQRLEKEPNSAGLRAAYAQALQNFGVYDQAAGEWEKAYEFDPKTLFYKERAAEMYASAGNKSRAKQLFKEVIDSAESDEQWLKDKASSNLDNLK